MRKNYKNTAAFCLAAAFSFATYNAMAADNEKAETAAAEEKQEASKLSIGDPVPALEGITWVQGEEVKNLNEEGKVYIIECWATWCGPCVAAIPHVNDLHKKYADKGLVVIGMNVWEDGLDKVKDFLEKKKDVMTYNVAYSGGKGSDFEKTWLKPADVRGIPHAFIVKDGKLALMTHPGSIDDKLIESLLDGSFDSEAFAKQKEEKAKQMEDIRGFIAKRDWDGLLEFANKLDDDSQLKVICLVTAYAKKSDWGSMLELREKAKSGKLSGNISPYMIDGQAMTEMTIGEGSKAYAEAALADQPSEEAKGPAAIQQSYVKARLLFLKGDVEEAKKAIAEAKTAVENSDDAHMKEYFGKLLSGAEKAMEEGKFPPSMQLLRK